MPPDKVSAMTPLEMVSKMSGKPYYGKLCLFDSQLSRDFPSIKNKVAWIVICDLTEL